MSPATADAVSPGPGCGKSSTPAPLIDRLPPLLKPGALLARDTSGCGGAHAALLALCAQGAAIGPSHRIDCPLGGGLHHPSIDLLLADGSAGLMAAAARELLAPLAGRVARAAEAHVGMTRRQIRALLCGTIDRAAAIDREIDGMRDDVARLNAYRGGGHAPIGDEICELLRRQPRVRARWKELQETRSAARFDIAETRFALNPVVITGGPTGSMLSRWADSTFDCHVIDQLDSASAIAALLSRDAPALRFLLGFLAGCRSGSPAFAVGDVQFAGAGIALAWRCHRDDLPGLLAHPAMAEPALAGRLITLRATLDVPYGASSDGREGHAATWRGHLAAAIRWRLCGRRMTHQLADDALLTHRQLAAECAAMAERAADPRAAAHLASLPGLALRVALGLRLGEGADDIKEGLVTAGQHALAMDLVRSASASHMETLARCPITAPATGLEAEIDVLVARLRIRGTLTRRELVRSYHRGDYRKLEPVLEAAVRKGLVIVDGDSLMAPDTGGCRRVGASAEAG